MTAERGADLATVLAAHRQTHRPQTGDSACSCDEWAGPFTRLDPYDERAHQTHVAEQVTAWLSEQLGSAQMRAHIANFIPLGFTERGPYESVDDAAEAVLAAVAERLGVAR